MSFLTMQSKKNEKPKAVVESSQSRLHEGNRTVVQEMYCKVSIKDLRFPCANEFRKNVILINAD